jgi:hypothetical protein
MYVSPGRLWGLLEAGWADQLFPDGEQGQLDAVVDAQFAPSSTVPEGSAKLASCFSRTYERGVASGEKM